MGKFVGVLWLFVICCISQVSGQVVLTEIMFDAAGNESHDEFIELFNLSDTDSVNLSGWQISDGSGNDGLVGHMAGTVLAPRQFGIILDATYFDNSTAYDMLIPDSSLILTIDNATLGSAGLSNSTPETISLLDTSGAIVSQYTYSLGNSPGFSDEKVILSGDNSQDNWSDSRILLGTPGARNSVSPSQIDVAVDANGIFFVPAQPRAGESVQAIIMVYNLGIVPVQDFEVSLFDDLNGDGVSQPMELVSGPVILAGALASADSAEVQLTYDEVNAGLHTLIIEVELDGDENPTNDRAVTQLPVPFPKGVLAVNEIMYRTDGLPEWVELVNLSPSQIDLTGWFLSDGDFKDASRIEVGQVVPPDDFIVIAEDSSIMLLENPPGRFIVLDDWPVLNNTGDNISLYDPTGASIDSLRFASSWGGDNNISLEKILPHLSSQEAENWRSSLVGSTPGLPNSVVPMEHDLTLVSTGLVTPNVTINAGNSVPLYATVQNVGQRAAANFVVAFYDDADFDGIGSQAERIGLTSGPADSLYFRDSVVVGIDYDNVSAGLHSIIAEVGDDDSESNNRATFQFRVAFSARVFSINEIMYAPTGIQAEWVELVNLSEDQINLNGWSLSDRALSRAVAISQNLLVSPGEFVVLAQDSVVTELTGASTLITVLESWPSLNNSGDNVVLYDPLGQKVDSLYYEANWGGGAGISLEKTNPELPSVEPGSWGGCQDITGSTPGRRNSLATKDRDLAVRVADIRFSPERPMAGENVEVTVQIHNGGLLAVPGFSVLLFDDLNRDGIGLPAEMVGQVSTVGDSLLAGDSVSVQFLYENALPGQRSMILDVRFAEDEFPANNVAYATLLVAFAGEPLRINEIMYSPKAERAEWIEIVNVGRTSVDLYGWVLSDADETNGGLIERTFNLESGRFFVVAEDSSVLDSGPPQGDFAVLDDWPGFRNDSDIVALYDPTGHLVDSVRYLDDWGGASGVSLEKINPNLPSQDSTSWSSAVTNAGGTPGDRNSLFIERVPDEASVSISPNPFSPDGDAHDDDTLISYMLPIATARINVKIYDLRGRLIRFLANNRPSGAEGLLSWDGKDDRGELARMGIYVVFLQAINAADGVLVSHKKTVVLAGRL